MLQLQPGFLLNSTFRIESLIGSGGMGDVYAAFDQTLNRKVAIKVLTAVQDPEDRERFKNEAKALSEFRHQGICSVYKLDALPNGTPFIVMELVEGESLRIVLRKQKTLAWKDAIKLTISLCAALEAVHAFKITHRDIKPENIILSPEGPKLLDFGLCRLPGQQLTQPGLLVGSVQYISPEQGRGMPASQASDLYAIGCVLFEMLTGDQVFDADNPVALVHKHAFSEPPKLSSYGACSDELEEILSRCLAKEPSERYASATELANELQQVLADGQEAFCLQNRAPQKNAHAAPDSRRKHTILACGLTITLVAALLSSTNIMRQLLASFPSPSLESAAVAQAKLTLAMRNYDDTHKLISAIASSVNSDNAPIGLASRTAMRRQLKELDDRVKTHIPSELDQTLLNDELTDFEYSMTHAPDMMEHWRQEDFDNYEKLLLTTTSKNKVVIQRNVSRMKDLSSAWHTRVSIRSGTKDLPALHSAHMRAFKSATAMLPKSEINFLNGVGYHLALYSGDYGAIQEAGKACLATGHPVEKQQVLLELIGEHGCFGNGRQAYRTAQECAQMNIDRENCNFLRASAYLRCAEFARFGGDQALAPDYFQRAEALAKTLYLPQEIEEYKQRRDYLFKTAGSAITNQSLHTLAEPPRQ